MQKKLIALAVAGLVSAPAFAQSNVTVYGVVDMGLVSYSGDELVGGVTDSARRTGVDSGITAGSRLGFRGVEDLGNGLKALFVLEFGSMTLDAAANGIGGTRQSFLGLSGNFGTVVAGRLQTPGYDWAAKYDVMGAAAYSPMGQISDSRLMTISGREGNARVANAIAYVSPNMGGVTMKAAYSFGEQTGTNVAGDRARQGILALAADYSNGPLNVGFVYHGLRNIAGVSNNKQRELALGASYDFGVVQPFVAYQNRKLDLAGAADYDDKLWSVGLRVPVAEASRVNVAYSRSTGDGSANKTTSYAVSFDHSLSKRTTVYAGYAVADFDNGALIETTGLAGIGNRYNFGGIDAIQDEKYKALAVGIRHTF